MGGLAEPLPPALFPSPSPRKKRTLRRPLLASRPGSWLGSGVNLGDEPKVGTGPSLGPLLRQETVPGFGPGSKMEQTTGDTIIRSTAGAGMSEQQVPLFHGPLERKDSTARSPFEKSAKQIPSAKPEEAGSTPDHTSLDPAPAPSPAPTSATSSGPAAPASSFGARTAAARIVIPAHPSSALAPSSPPEISAVQSQRDEPRNHGGHPEDDPLHGTEAREQPLMHARVNAGVQADLPVQKEAELPAQPVNYDVDTESALAKCLARLTLRTAPGTSSQSFLFSIPQANPWANLTLLDLSSQRLTDEDIGVVKTEAVSIPPGQRQSLEQSRPLGQANKSVLTLAQACPCLTHLCLNQNLLTDRGVGALPPLLQSLQLRHNLLSDTTHFAHLIHLDHLDLSDNRIERLEGMLLHSAPAFFYCTREL